MPNSVFVENTGEIIFSTADNFNGVFQRNTIFQVLVIQKRIDTDIIVRLVLMY